MEKVREIPKFADGPLKLYLDDIMEIISLMREVDEKGELEIVVGDYRLSDLQEIKNIKPKEHKELVIRFNVSEPYATLSLRISEKYSTFEYFSAEDSLALQGVFSQIEKILLSARRQWRWVEQIFSVATGVLITAPIFILEGEVFNGSFLTAMGVVMTLVWLFAAFLFILTKPVRKSKIILVNKAEHTTFWKRNKDAIILTTFSSLLSFILGILATLLLQQFGK